MREGVGRGGGGDGHAFPVTPSEMKVILGNQPHLETHQNRTFAKPQHIRLSKNLLWLKSEAVPIPSGEMEGL